jgi:glycosyltransferase involved in cell wall biosynthesis
MATAQGGAAPVVSAVVPTRNSAATLEACLRSLRSQTLRDVEIIVVDDLSRDATPAIARHYADTVVSRSASRSAARNLGLAASRGEFCLALDSDMTLAPNGLERSVAAARAEGAAVVVPEIAVGDGFWGRALAFNRNLSMEDQLDGRDGHPRLFPRAPLLELGGWDPDLVYAEDADLTLRWRAHGGRITVADTRVYHRESAPNLRDIYAKWKFYYETWPRFRAKHPEYPASSFGREVRRSYARRAGLSEVARHPALAAGGVLIRVTRLLAMADARRSTAP